MGIKQLTTYIREHNKTLYEEEIPLSGRKLVFDGGALYYALFRAERCDMRFGGDYSELYTVFKKYFSKLKEAGVHPYVVLDGGSNIPIKNATIRDRFARDVNALKNLANMQRSSNFPKPRLMKSVLVEVLVELKINYVLAKGEADMLVATLANRLRCPLVSGDSDFFVVPVLEGVIPVEPMLDIGELPQLKCHRFRYTKLSSLLNIHQDFLPLLALLMGNDYTDEFMLEHMQKRCGASASFNVLGRVGAIRNYLSRFKSTDEVINDLSNDDEQIRVHIGEVLSEFDLQRFEAETNELFPLLAKVFSLPEKSGLVCDFSLPQETFLKHLVYSGLANPCILDIHLHRTHFIRPQCDDLSRKPCSDASEQLRTYLYVLLLHGSCGDNLNVSEFKRCGKDYLERSVQISIPEWTRVFPIDILTNPDYSINDKQVIFCDLTRFPMEYLKSIPDNDQLFLVSVRYWVLQSSESGNTLKIEHVHAILVCYILLKSGQSTSRCRVFDLAAAHHYARWQSIMFYLVILNTMFRHVIPSSVLSKCYHGNHVHQLYHLLNEGAGTSSLLTSPDDREMLEDYMKVITMNADNCLIYKQSPSFRKRTRVEEQRPPLHRPQCPRPSGVPIFFGTGNRFAPFGR